MGLARTQAYRRRERERVKRWLLEEERREADQEGRCESVAGCVLQHDHDHVNSRASEDDDGVVEVAEVYLDTVRKHQLLDSDQPQGSLAEEDSPVTTPTSAATEIRSAAAAAAGLCPALAWLHEWLRAVSLRSCSAGPSYGMPQFNRGQVDVMLSPVFDKFMRPRLRPCQTHPHALLHGLRPTTPPSGG